MTVIVTPDRSLQQRRAALKTANEIRIARAQLKRDIKTGHADASAILIDPPTWADTMKIVTLLRAVPSIGDTKIAKILGEHRVSPSKTVGGLSDRQRTALAADLINRGL